MSAPWFRTTDLLRWGAANSGGDLSAVMFDENTWYFYSSIVALQARPIPAEIDHFGLVGDQLTVYFSDHTIRGPYTIPTSAFRWRGAWMTSTTYLINDVFAANGSIYIVIWDHTSSATSFDPGANDGSGHNYYALMLATPGNALPTGGAVGQMLTKTTTTDFSVSWGWPLPTGGFTDQILMKDSNTNQDATWHTAPFVWAPPPSPPSTPGFVLSTIDGTSTNTAWVEMSGGGGGGGISAPPVSPGGNPGQGWISVDGTTDSVEWAWLYGAPNSPGSAGQVPVSVDGSITNVAWRNYTVAGLIDFHITSSPAESDRLRFSETLNKWESRSGRCRDEGNTSGTYIVDPITNGMITLVPTGDITLSNAARSPQAGDILSIEITTSGTTSYNISFSSTDWITQGTLATGTVSGKVYVMTFRGNTAGKLVELSRVGPM